MKENTKERLLEIGATLFGAIFGFPGVLILDYVTAPRCPCCGSKQMRLMQ